MKDRTELVELPDGYALYLSPRVALSLIKSLATQMASNNINLGRLEWRMKKVRPGGKKVGDVYFTIGVIQEDV